MHPLTCVKYGAAALVLGPAHSVMVPCGAASEYLSATSKIHYCIGSLNVGVAPRVQHFSAFHYYCCACSKISISINKYMQKAGESEYDAGFLKHVAS